MKYTTLLILSTFLIWTSCVTPKSARALKRETKQWRESKVVLEGFFDSPMSGSFLTLRENGKFEHTSSGMFGTFEAGTWEQQQDTIQLFYITATKKIERTERAVIDRESQTLIFEGAENPEFQRMRLMILEI